MKTYEQTAGLSSAEVRSNDGRGNNLTNPELGMVGGTYSRVTETTYGSTDGATWETPVSIGGDLPETVEISTAVFGQGGGADVPNSYGVNEYFQFFGQFVAHDIAQAKGGQEELLHEFAGPIPLRRDAFEIDDQGVRQTVTKTTTFVDLSPVYGKTDEVEDLLREPGSAKLLLTSDNRLPSVAEVAEVHGQDAQAILPQFQVLPISVDLPAAGDERAFQTPQLASIHTVWARNHNYHADKLSEAHPDWTVDEVFEAARILNEAEYQNVVFNEYVTKLYGRDALSTYSGYSAAVDPSIINEFTTVAFRFGHDQASEMQIGLDEAGGESFNLTLSESIAATGSAIKTEEDLDTWIRGQLSQSSQEIDGKVVPSAGALSVAPGISFDLKAIDIARGRDHGVNDYNLLREGLGLSTYASFDEFGAANNVDAATLDILKTVYGDDISKLDSLVGGLLEKDVAGSQLGETFTLLGVMQWENLRDGDRFYFEERLKDMPALLADIQDVTLADILARTTGIDNVYRDAFSAHKRLGGTDQDDKLVGTRDADLVIGFDGADRMYGKRGEDDLFGGNGNDFLAGGMHNDVLHGGAGNDKLLGGWGDDLLNGGAGNDKLWGGKGDDTFVFEQGSGVDRIIGFDKHNDKIDLSDYGFTSFDDVKAATSSMWFFSSSIDLGDGNAIKLYGVSKWSITEDNFILAQSDLEPKAEVEVEYDWGNWGSWNIFGDHHDAWF